MNIKIHAFLVLAACSVTGLALGGFIVDRYLHIEQSMRVVGPTSATMLSVKRLQQSVGEWLKINDVVLHKDQAFLIGTSMREARSLLELIDGLAHSPLAEDQQSALDRVEQSIGSLSDLVLRTRNHNGADREQRIAELAAAADSQADGLLAIVGGLEQTLRRRAEYRYDDLADQQGWLGVWAAVCALIYLGVVVCCWLWIAHRVVKPIEDLSRAAGAADHEERDFVLPKTGPDEVKRLTENISSFVQKLQDAKANTEEEVRQRTEELVQASQAKGAFIATMSHELRTPLNGIINMNELILDTGLDQEQAGFARTAKNAAEALLGLINDILDFSKIEARKLEIEAVEFDLRALVDGAVDILAGVAEGKRLEIQAVVAPEVPASLVGDPTRLRQVLINLLNNALKFTSQGSVSVVVSVLEQNKIDASLRIEVRDTGIGIPEDRRGSLFRAFEQVDSSTTRKFGGTGLGLAICRELVGLMGGEIDVDSVMGVGSTFWLTVRLGKVPAGALAPMPATADGVVVISARPLVRDRLLAQLQFLGMPAKTVVGVEHAGEFLVPTDKKWLAVVDPYGRGDDALAEVERAAAQKGIIGDRVAVLDHWMRHWTKEMGPAPAGRIGLTDPTGHEQLRNWLAGEPTSVSIRSPKVAAKVDKRIADAEDAAAAESARNGPASAPAECRGRVLVAEDNPVNQRVVRSILERGSYEVVMAEDGQQAFDAFVKQPFDLVLMDCQMPVMDGLEATRLIRMHEFERSACSAVPSRVPIVALTANAEEGFSEKCFDAGMDRFLAKPCRKQSLLDTLASMLKGKQSTAGASATKLRVLVAEDSPINQKVVQSVLGRAGYELVMVENGQQAIDEVRRQSFALVLMDCQMPILDGLDATRRIRELEASGGLAEGMPGHLPIVALTGNSLEGDKRAVLEAGMDRCVTKPFRPTELVEVVAEFAGRRRND